ncbi:DNA transposase THAP9, partial [Orchesella cincta]
MVLCSDHFSPDVIIESWGRRRVIKNGYPTLVAGENIVKNLKVSQETVIEESGSCEITCEDDTCHCGAAARVTEQNLIIQNLTKELAETKSYADELSTLLETARSQLDEKRNTVRALNQKEKRRERKHKEGKQKRKLEEETATMTKKTKLDEEDRQKALLNELLTRTGANTKSPFSYMLREFSFELHYYSPRAYNYVRSYLSCLPHPQTLSSWTNAIKSKPGFLPSSIEFLKIKNAESVNTLYYALSCDEVYMRKQIIHDGDGFIGFTDYGDIVENEEPDKESKTALFLMATAINARHRVPVGYVLTNGLTSDVLANILKKTLEVLHSTNSKVLSITFDGLGVNMRAVTKLGANLEVESDCFQPYFLHPSTQDKVHVILDPSHMIKLLRNLWNHYKVLIDMDGNEIKWQYISELQKLQSKCGLRAANKLSSRHVMFHKQKMKTNLCVQTLSNSNSVSLGVCRELRMPGFGGSEATEKFLAMSDRLFDSLNSKTTGSGYKSPIHGGNLNTYKNFFTQAKQYFSSLKVYIDGKPKLLLHTGRKTALVGLITTITSIENIMEEIISNENEYLKYQAVEEEFDNEEDEVDMYIPSNEEASFINNIVAYIAGYVVRKICTNSSCPRCICKLMADENDVPKIADDCVLILKKDNGGLILPSHVVISVCKLTEHRVREVKANGLRKMKKKNLVDYVLSQSRERNLIHDFQCNSDEIGTAHACSLVRQIASIYLTARMHHLAKETTFQLCPTTVR